MIGILNIQGSEYPYNGAKIQKIGDESDGKVRFKFLEGDRKDWEGAIEPIFIEFQAQDSKEVEKLDSIELT